MDDADAHTNSLVPPRKRPGISARRDLAAHDEDGFPFVVVGRIKIVLSAHTETPKSGIDPRLAKHRTPITRGINHNLCAGGEFEPPMILCADAHDYSAAEQGSTTVVATRICAPETIARSARN